MNKKEILAKITEGVTLTQVRAWIQTMPNETPKTPQRLKPSTHKVGDIFMHYPLNHPMVILKKRRNGWFCVLLTSDKDCPELIEPHKSRFQRGEGGFTSTIVLVSELPNSFVGVYDNNKHLREVYNKLQEMM